MFDYEELRRAAIALGYSADIANALSSVAVALDKHGLGEEDSEVVLELLSNAGRRKLGELPERLLQGQWEDFNYGNVKVGDYVRVKPDAYDSDTGVKHNGLVGIMTYMAGRKCTVAYIGEENGKIIKHPMTSLDSLKLW